MTRRINRLGPLLKSLAVPFPTSTQYTLTLAEWAGALEHLIQDRADLFVSYGLSAEEARKLAESAWGGAKGVAVVAAGFAEALAEDISRRDWEVFEATLPGARADGQ